MRLSAAARYFDKTICSDAFSPSTTFRGQLDLFDDSKRDGATVVRRILSVDPTIAIPARRVITIGTEQWIVGASQADDFAGSPIRAKYVIHRAHGAAVIKTMAQTLGTGGSLSTYGSKLWIKDMKELEVSSGLFGFYNLYLPTPDAVAPGSVVSLLNRLHLVRSVYLSAAGLNVAEADELGLTALTVGTYTPMTYSAASDGRTPGGGVALNVVRLRYQDLYAYQNEAETKYAEGDLRVFIRKADVATAKVNDQFTVGGETYEILSVANEDGGACWGLHLRHAG